LARTTSNCTWSWRSTKLRHSIEQVVLRRFHEYPVLVRGRARAWPPPGVRLYRCCIQPRRRSAPHWQLSPRSPLPAASVPLDIPKVSHPPALSPAEQGAPQASVSGQKLRLRAAQAASCSAPCQPRSGTRSGWFTWLQPVNDCLYRDFKSETS
jgi:hypothetical protein